MQVEDKAVECAKWSFNGGCKLDQDFGTSKININPDYTVDSISMFDFMQRTCLKSCGWAENGKILDKNFYF